MHLDRDALSLFHAENGCDCIRQLIPELNIHCDAVVEALYISVVGTQILIGQLCGMKEGGI